MPSVSKKQHNLMAMVANDPAKAKSMNIPQSVGKDFMAADKGKKFGAGTRADSQSINRPKTNQGKGELFSRGGEMKESKAMAKKEVSFMQKKGAPKSMIKHEMAEMGMKSGGRTAVKGDHAVQTKAKRGAQMVKMATGGYVRSADGVATKGKTEARQVVMPGNRGMKHGGKC